MGTADVPPLHVRSTFGLRDAEGVPHGGAWRYDEVLLSPVTDHAHATWSAGVRENLVVDGVRVARPVRSTDGRWVVAGWSADTLLAGTPEPRHDEVVAVAGRLSAALSALPCPRFLLPAATATATDASSLAERAAWGEDVEPFSAAPGPLDPTSVQLFRDLARSRRRVTGSAQVVHGDLFGTVLFAGSADPGIVDVQPCWRPAPWSAAVAVVDAVAWGGADEGLLQRWSGLPEWPQLLLRAVLYRLAVHTLHERSTPDGVAGLTRTGELVRRMV